MSVTAEAERTLDLPRERAFELFIDYSNWHRWMPKSFAPLSGPPRALQEGDRIEVRIPPIKAKLRVSRVRPGEQISWEGSGPGVHAEHSFLFEDAGEGRTRIRSVEPWTGPLLRLSPIARIIQREAERIGAAQLDGFLAYARDRGR